MVNHCGKEYEKELDKQIQVSHSAVQQTLTLQINYISVRGFTDGTVVKNLPAGAGDAREVDLIPWSGRSLGAGTGNPLQYSCLENSVDRGAWQTTVHEVAKSPT